MLKVTIEVPWAGEVNVYCTQLDHLDENWRMKQIDAITRGDESPHILLGGLNSLDGSDYSTERWNHIVKVKLICQISYIYGLRLVISYFFYK